MFAQIQIWFYKTSLNIPILKEVAKKTLSHNQNPTREKLLYKKTDVNIHLQKRKSVNLFFI